MFQELSGGPLPNGRFPDITLAIFPHLQEFLAVDTRGLEASVKMLTTEDVFTDDYFRAVESEFAGVLREGKDKPFLHLMHLPTQVDDMIRGVAMHFILERLGVDIHDADNLPEVVVFVISGPTLAVPADQVLAGFSEMLSGKLHAAEVDDWVKVLGRLIEMETKAIPVTDSALGESMTDESLDPYYLWQNRN